MNDECDKQLKQTNAIACHQSHLISSPEKKGEHKSPSILSNPIILFTRTTQHNTNPFQHFAQPTKNHTATNSFFLSFANHVIFQVTTDLGLGGASVNAYRYYVPSTLALSDSRLHGSRGCLGCFSKPLVIISMGEADASKGPNTMNVDNRSEDFWSSSAIELDHGATHSQRSISSIAVSNHPSDPQTSDAIQTDPPQFVNHGLLLWNQMRHHWVGNKRSERQTQVGEPKISWNATYESLLGTSKPFPQHIPLGEMVDFLVDIWELEGMYD